MRSATPDDAIMNERFNMFESLHSQIEFHRSMGQSAERLEKALAFLEKLQVSATTPGIDTYT